MSRSAGTSAAQLASVAVKALVRPAGSQPIWPRSQALATEEVVPDWLVVPKVLGNARKVAAPAPPPVCQLLWPKRAWKYSAMKNCQSPAKEPTELKLATACEQNGRASGGERGEISV